MKLTVIRVGKVALQEGVGTGRANTVTGDLGCIRDGGGGTILGRGESMLNRYYLMQSTLNNRGDWMES